MSLVMAVLIILIVYLIVMAIVVATAFMFAMIPMFINGIGLARICERMGAFKPGWAWIWSLFCPVVAILRAGDIAVEWENPLGCRRHFRKGVALLIICAVLLWLMFTCLFLITLLPENPRFYDTINFFGVLSIISCVLAMMVSVWLTVLVYISHYRIFKQYVPTWGVWLILLGMFLCPQLSFWVLPVLSFFPVREY